MGGGEAQMGNVNAAISLRTENSDTEVVPNYWAERGKKLIDENYARLYGVEDVCTTLGISTAYFRDVFSAAFSVSPKLYLTLVKIERAQLILKDSSRKVSEVAAMVGFRQRSVFERNFKGLLGVSPSGFRKLVSTGDFDTRK